MILKTFDSFQKYLTEDGEAGGPPGAATLASTPGMGEPVYATRGIEGSGDVSEPIRKKKKVKKFNQFTNNNK